MKENQRYHITLGCHITNHIIQSAARISMVESEKRRIFANGRHGRRTRIRNRINAG